MFTSAAGLAGAVTAQVFIGEEVLFLAAITLLVMAISYAVADRDLARRALPGFAGGLAIAAGLALLVLGYPLWFQFAGPQGVADGMFTPAYFSADLSSWWTLSPLSVAGSDESARLTTGPAEYNTFLGWPLLLVAAVCAIWAGRRRLVFACVAAGLVMGALSLGPEVVLGGTRTAIPGPYALIGGLPVVDGALPMRFALALLPIVATLLVLAVDRALRSSGRARRLVPLAVGVALLPLFPTPLPTAGRPRRAGIHHRRPLAAVRTAGRGAGAGAAAHPEGALADALGDRRRRRFRAAGRLLHRPVREGRHRGDGHLQAAHLRAAGGCRPAWRPTGHRRRAAPPGRPRRGLLGRLLRGAHRRRPPRGKPAHNPGTALRPGDPHADAWTWRV